MNSRIKVDAASQVPVYKQLMQSIRDLVYEGGYAVGDYLPSMNELSAELNISKETVKKAYSLLRDEEMIGSAQGKGFYITNKNGNKIKILVLFDKLSTYKQVLFSSFSSHIGEQSEITIRLHNQDVELFEQFVEENLDKFDYYLVTPHFSLCQEVQARAIKTLKRIPNRKLILLDRYVDGLQGNFGSVYQDFEHDIYDGLTQGKDDILKFKRINIVSMKGSLYAPIIETGIKSFCDENSFAYEFLHTVNPDKIEKGEIFLILNSQLDAELIELVRIAKMKGCRIGKDIGIISYNESPINEIILDGLTVMSTDFIQMGELAAKMILEKPFRKIHCDFRLIRRRTF